MNITAPNPDHNVVAGRAPGGGSRREIVAGSVWTALGLGATTVAGPVLMVAVVRVMSRQQYGALAIATSLVGLLAILAALGLGATLAQMASADQVKLGDAGVHAALRASLRLAIIAGVVVIPFYGAVLLVADRVSTLRPAVPALASMMPIIAVAPLVDVCTGFLRAVSRPRAIAVAAAATAMATLVPTVGVLAITRPSAQLIGGIRSAGALVTTIALAWPVLAWRRRHLAEAPARVPATRVLRFAAAMMLTGVFSVALDKLDVFVLGVAWGSHEVALYAPASALATAAMGLSILLAAFYFPVVSRAAARGDHAEVRQLYYWATRWNLVLYAPVLTVLVACPASVMRVIFGPDYAPVGGPLRVLGIGVVGQVVLGFNGLTLAAYGLPGIVVIRQIISLLASVIACVLLIPRFGIYGAALATSSALLLANALCTRSLLARFGVWPWNRASLATFAAFAMAAACAGPIGDSITTDLRPFVEGAFVGAVTLAVAIGVAEPGERRAILRQLLRLRSRRLLVGSSPT